MDLFYVLASILLFAISLFVICIHLYSHDAKRRLPPVNFGWPLIGETLQFTAAHKKGMLEDFVRERGEKYGSPVFKTSLLGHKFAVFSGLAANKFVVKNENEFLSGWKPPNANLLFPSNNSVSIEHDPKNFRKYLGILFGTDSAQKFITTLDTFSQSHLKNHWQRKNEVKVYPLLKLYMFNLGCKIFLGLEDTDQTSNLLNHMITFIKGIAALPVNVPGTTLHRALRAGKVLRKEIGCIIKQRRVELSQGIASPTENVLSNILSVASNDGEAMSDSEIIDKILVLILGGIDTTAGTLAFTMKYLAEMPHLYDQVVNEQLEIRRSMKPREVLCWDDIQSMKFTWSFVNEVLRVIPVATGNFREVKKDIYYDGFVIPKGWKIYWTVGLTPRDCFCDPEKFNPSRFEDGALPIYAHIPFSLGYRMCSGKEYARLTVLVFLHQLLTTFKWESVLHDEKIKYEVVPYPEKGYPARLFAL